VLDLGTLQAHIELEGADKFKSDLDTSGTKADTLGSKIKGGLATMAKAAATALAALGTAAATAFTAIAKGSIDA
jgi:hypothetical protein